MEGSRAPETRRLSQLRFCAVVFFILLFGAVFAWWVVERTDRRMRDDLIYQVRLAVRSIEVEQVRALSGGEEDLSKNEYLLLERRLSALRGAAGCRYVYLVRRRPARDDPEGTEVIFLVEAQDDGVENSPPSQPGDVYEEGFITEEFAALFDGGAPFVEGPVEDEWGVWVSALAPLVDQRTGELLAVLGMDYDAKLWRWKVAADSVLPIGLMLALLLILIALVSASRPVDDSPRPVLRRLLPPMVLALLLITSTAVILLWWEYYGHLKERLNGLHAALFTEFQMDLKHNLSAMGASIGYLSNDPRFQRALASRDAETLAVEWQGLFERLRLEYGVTRFSFADALRLRILSFDAPEMVGERIDVYLGLKAASTRAVASGAVVAPSGEVLLLCIVPVFKDGRLAGYVESGKGIREILQSRYLNSGSHLAVVLRETAPPMYMEEKDRERRPGRMLALSTLNALPPDIISPDPGETALGQKRLLERTFQGADWNISVIPFEDASGRSVGDLVILTDITAEKEHLRKQVSLMWGIGATIASALLILFIALLRRTDEGILAQQAALRESDTLLKKLSRQIPGVLYQYRQYPDGRIDVPFVSDNIRDVCELEPDEVLEDGSRFFSRIHPEDRKAFGESAAQSFETMDTWEFEFRAMLPKKGERWLRGTGNPEKLPDGSVLWHGFLADCTERRAREEESRKQAGLIASLLNSIPDIVFYKNKDGVFLGCNPPHEELTGRSEAETVGKTDYDFYDGETADFYREKDRRVLAEMRPSRNEEWVTYPDGRRALLDTLKTPFLGRDGELVGLLGISRDITERNRMEEELRGALQAANAASLAKSAFLASMSHEIRTPMNAILGFSQLLEKDPELSPEQMQHVRIINRSGEHLLALINDILEMAKIEAGSMTLNKGPFSPCTLLSDVVSLFRTPAVQKSLSMETECDEGLRTAVLLGDGGKLRQVLVNLVGNAVKFTQRGGVTVRFRIDPPSSANERAFFLAVEVEDSGIGISREQGELIFAPFHQSEAGKNAGGTGLGLAISRKFVEIMGGALSFDSEPGKGTLFRFRVPVERASESFAPSVQPEGRVTQLETESERPVSSKNALDLSRIPSSILRSVHAAVEEGDIGRVKELVLDVSALDAKAGEGLLLLAQRYDYEGLLEAIRREGRYFDDE